MPPAKATKKKASPAEPEPAIPTLGVGTINGRKEAAERRRVADEELVRSTEGSKLTSHVF